MIPVLLAALAAGVVVLVLGRFDRNRALRRWDFVLSGRADIAACAQEFKNIGRRADIWQGSADSVYCGTCPRVTVRCIVAIYQFVTILTGNAS